MKRNVTEEAKKKNITEIIKLAEWCNSAISAMATDEDFVHEVCSTADLKFALCLALKDEGLSFGLDRNVEPSLPNIVEILLLDNGTPYAAIGTKSEPSVHLPSIFCFTKEDIPSVVSWACEQRYLYKLNLFLETKKADSHKT